MKLLYTMFDPLTQVLTQEAVGLVEQGKRVFYMHPTLFPLKKKPRSCPI